MYKSLLLILFLLISNSMSSQMLPSEETYNEIQRMAPNPNTDYNNYKYVDVIEKRFEDHKYSPTVGSSNWYDILIWDTSQFNWRGNFQYFFDYMNTDYFSNFFNRLMNGDRYNEDELNRFYDELRTEYQEVPIPDSNLRIIFILLLTYIIIKKRKTINSFL